MDIFGVLKLIGGLAMFLFGMKVLGKSLEKLAGGKLERILEKLTSNKLKAVLLGAGVTAVIQSSSATTVMVVGFVNSGIMKLNQAIGVILGANIGTTATSWILSLTGIESDNFFLKMLMPTSFSPILAIIGVGMIMMSKRDKLRQIGSIMIGFAVLMFGMDAMSVAVAPLANVPEFASILTMFSNPILGVLAGAILTAIIQSSSASVGILQALSATGQITFGSALPIIMGQNIGTCATAIISSIGAKKNAKRAAAVHLIFNVIGTTLFLVIFYTLNAIFNFDFVTQNANAAGIAIIHTVFNIFATAALLPFTKLLEKLACMIIKDDKLAVDDDFKLLDERFLDTPTFAIGQCKTLSVKMSVLAQETLNMAIEQISNFDKRKAEQIATNEDKIDQYEDRIGSYLVQLSSRDLSFKDSQSVTTLLHCIGDFERISDHALNISEGVLEMKSKKVEFTQKAKDELTVFTAALTDIVNLAIASFGTNDIAKAKLVEPLEEVIDDLKTELKKRHIKRLRKGKCTIEMGFILSDILTNYERIADHCSNIAVCLIQINENSFDTHEYLNDLKLSEDKFFTEKFKFYDEKYKLPMTKKQENQQDE